MSQDTWAQEALTQTLREQVAHEFTPGVLRGLERPEGVLKVNLIEAVNVPKADLFKWSDPYVV